MGSFEVRIRSSPSFSSFSMPYRCICSLMVLRTISGISYLEYCSRVSIIFLSVRPEAAAFHRERGLIR
jgi:hypothetical protein